MEKIPNTHNNESQDIPETSEELTTSEANKYQFISKIHNPDYHIEEIDKALGTKYEAKLKTDKHGNTYFKSKTRYGGFYYLGSLLCTIVLSIALIASVINIIRFIQNKDYMNTIVFAIIVIPFCVAMDIHFIKELIIEVKEKIHVKKLIKEGKKTKEKINFGTILYRIAIFIFLLFIGFILFGLIMQETNHSLSTDFAENIIKVLFISFAVVIFIISVYLIYIGIKTVINRFKTNR